jgi:hypothetical protein
MLGRGMTAGEHSAEKQGFSRQGRPPPKMQLIVLLSGSFEATLAELVKPCVTIRALCYLSVNLVGK